MSWEEHYHREAKRCLDECDRYSPKDRSAERQKWYDMYLTYVFLAEEHRRKLEEQNR